MKTTLDPGCSMSLMGCWSRGAERSRMTTRPSGLWRLPLWSTPKASRPADSQAAVSLAEPAVHSMTTRVPGIAGPASVARFSTRGHREGEAVLLAPNSKSGQAARGTRPDGPEPAFAVRANWSCMCGGAIASAADDGGLAPVSAELRAACHFECDWKECELRAA